MAIVHIALVNASARSVHGVNMPVPDSVPVAVDTITSIEAVATSSASSPAGAENLFWHVVSDTACYVTFDGSTPAAGEGFFLPAGQALDAGARPAQTPKVVAA